MSLTKQFREFEQQIIERLPKQGMWHTWYSEKYMLIAWLLLCILLAKKTGGPKRRSTWYFVPTSMV
jgi:hypothetical protein